ncbi:MAG: rhodanese-like domain-containing protein [Desulfuromonas sp.]|nr:MAG: rhodanese-like domain-containing protein [Desulfuromonas sp.]
MVRIFGSLLLAGLVLWTSIASASQVKHLDALQAQQLLRDPSIFLLDVRTPMEFGQARLDGANLIPIDQFLKREREVPKNRPILIYCAVGSRSNQVARYLAQRGYPQVYNLYGGIVSWQRQGLPVLRGPGG